MCTPIYAETDIWEGGLIQVTGSKDEKKSPDLSILQVLNVSKSVLFKEGEN